MAAKVAAQAATAESVETLKEQAARLRAELKETQAALKAAAPKQTPLEKEIARQGQATARIDHLLSKMLERRIKAGQEREVAIQDIVALCQQLLTADN